MVVQVFMTSSQFHVPRLMLILSISRDCMLSILQPYGLQGFFSLFPRKFFKSSSSQRITASLSTQAIQERSPYGLQQPILLQLLQWSHRVEQGTLLVLITEVHWLMSKAKWMERCHHVMTHPSLGTRISEEALSFPYYDILWFFGSFLRSDNPVPIRGSSDTSTNNPAILPVYT